VNSFLLRQFKKARYKLYDSDAAYWRRLYITSQPDLIVINDPGTYHCVLVGGLFDVLMQMDIPFITISHGNNEHGAIASHAYKKARTLFAQASTCVFVSNRNRDVARRQLCLPLDQSVVLDNPPAFEDLSILPFPTTAIPHFAIVARLECEGKGQDLVLDILSRPEWRGDGPDAPYLTDLINFYELKDRVHLAGHCPDIRGLWAKHSILLLCSHVEGKSLAVTEALVCGRPVVTTDVGGNSELIINRHTGFIAESATIASFGHTLERAWQERDRWEAMGTLAHSTILERLDKPPSESLLELFESALPRWANYSEVYQKGVKV